MKQMYRYTFEGVNSETGEVNQSLDEIEIDGLPDQNHIQYSKGFYIWRCDQSEHGKASPADQPELVQSCAFQLEDEMYLIGGYFVTNANYRVYENRLEEKSLLPFEFYNGR